MQAYASPSKACNVPNPDAYALSLRVSQTLGLGFRAYLRYSPSCTSVVVHITVRTDREEVHEHRTRASRFLWQDVEMGVSDSRGPQYSTLNSRVLMKRTPK